MISRPRKSIDKNFSKNEDNQTQFPIIRSQCSSYNDKGLKDAAGFESLVDFVRIYGSTRLRLLFEQPECDHAWNLMQRQETNVNEANAFRWRMRARSAVCTAVTCDFNPLTFTKTGIIFLIKNDITKRTKRNLFLF